MPALRRTGFFVVFLFVALLAAPPASARERAGNDTARAKAHFAAAEAHFSLGEFGPALNEYRKAYLLRPLPPMLFNMAQCHRHLGDLEKAAFLLRRFLTMSPTPVQRSQAEAVLQDVELALKSKKTPNPAEGPKRPVATRPLQAASAPSEPPRPTTRPSTPIATAPAALAALGKTPTTPASQSAPTRKLPLYKRWWLWTIVAGAAVATATAIGVVASRGDDLPKGTLPTVDYR
jgi:tetratricopeptide (TPR) repeat protein